MSEQKGIEIANEEVVIGDRWNIHRVDLRVMGTTIKLMVFEDVETGEMSSPQLDVFGTYLRDGTVKRKLPEDFEITLFVDNKISKKTVNHRTFKTVQIEVVKE